MSAETPGMIFEASDLDVALPRARRTALSGLSLGLKSGEILTLLGDHASGRDVLRDMLIRLLPARAIVAGTFVLGDRAAGKLPRIAYLAGAAAPALSPHAPMDTQLVRTLARRRRLPPPRAREEFRLALERLPGAPHLEKLQQRPDAISARERALTFLAFVLTQNPDAVVADAPGAGLDPTEAEDLIGLLLKEQTRAGFALVCFTGDPALAARLGGRIAVLRDGRLVEEGSFEDLNAPDADAYTQALFRATLRLGARAQQGRGGPRSEPLLQVRSLAFEKPKRDRPPPADSVTFDLRRGASLALVGRRGSGRRAIVNAVLGLTRAPQGRVIFDSVDIGVLLPEMLARLRRRVAFVTGDDHALDPRMTVHEVVVEPMRMHIDLGAEENRRAAEAALKRVGLGDVPARRRVADLSLLDRRRLQVARALAAVPHLVVLYEPLAGLDALGQALLLDLLRDFRKREGAAFLVVTANFAVAEALADDALVVQGGRIVARGAVAEIVREPRDAYTAALVAAVSLPRHAAAQAGLPPETPQG